MKYDTLAVDVIKAIGEKLQAYLTSVTDVLVFFEETQPEDIEQNSIEIRLDGPTVDEIANKQYHVTVEVDLLLTFKMQDNIFTRRQVLAFMSEALREDVPLIISGENVGCLSTARPFGGTEKVETVDYGKVNKDRRLLHSAVSTTLHILI